MSPLRLFLLDYDPDLNSTLVHFFCLEGIEVTICNSVDELKRRVAADPHRVVIADWCGACIADDLTTKQCDEIEAVGRASAGIVLTSGHSWATYASPKFKARVIVVAKPYDLDVLLEAVRSVGSSRTEAE